MSPNRLIVLLLFTLARIRVGCVANCVVIANTFIKPVHISSIGERILECLAAIHRLFAHRLINQTKHGLTALHKRLGKLVIAQQVWIQPMCRQHLIQVPVLPIKLGEVAGGALTADAAIGLSIDRRLVDDRVV